MHPKQGALARRLNVDARVICASKRDSSVFRYKTHSYLVLTPIEARWRVMHCLHRVPLSFLALHIRLLTPMPTKDLLKVLGPMRQNPKAFNPILGSLLQDREAFIDGVVDTYGLGRILAEYDSLERKAGRYLIYQLT